MDRLPQVAAEQLAARMRGEFDRVMSQVMQAVNEAPQGRVIVDSEEKVRDLMAEFRCSTYQAALQLRGCGGSRFFPGGQG